MIACSQEKPPKLSSILKTSVVFQSYCYYLIGMRLQKGCSSIMLLIISPSFILHRHIEPFPKKLIPWCVSRSIKVFTACPTIICLKTFLKREKTKHLLYEHDLTGIIWQGKLYNNIKHVKNNFVGGNTLHNKKHQWTTINNVCEYCYRASPCYLQCK